MKILHFVESMGIGGIQELINILSKYSKHEIIVLTNNFGQISDEMIARGVTVTRDKTIAMDCDIVHTHTCGYQSNDGAVVAAYFKKPLVESIHSPQGSVLKTSRTATVARFYQNNFDYLPPMLELDKYKPSKGTAVGRVGRLVPEKRYEDFIKVADSLDEIKFLLAGTPEVDSKYYCGLVRDLPKFYSKLKIFLYPTRDEACPMSIAQAMASKVAVITYDLPATQELVGDSGILVPYGDIEGLKKAVLKLYYDDNLRNELVEQAYERVKHLDAKVVSPMYDKLYEGI